MMENIINDRELKIAEANSLKEATVSCSGSVRKNIFASGASLHIK